MKPSCAMAVTTITVLATLILWPVNFYAQQNTSVPKPGKGKVRWFVQLDPGDPQYIEVTIDTTKISVYSLVEEISFDVAFYNSQGAFLKKETFDFTDEKVEYLRQGIHRRRFSYSSQAASEARGVDLFYTVRPIGIRPEKPNRYVESKTDPELNMKKDGVQEYHPPDL